MNDEQALLQTVLQNPDDDAPRLVLADFLEEHGQEERAEFIRVQCELAEIDLFEATPAIRMKADNLMERYRKNAPIPLRANTPAVRLVRHRLKLDALHRRERELSTLENCCNWFTLPGSAALWNHNAGFNGWGFVDGAQIRCEIKRGWPEAITCSFSDWLTHHAAILAAVPLLEVTLTDRPSQSWINEQIRKRWTAIDDAGIGRALQAEWPSIKTWNLPDDLLDATRYSRQE